MNWFPKQISCLPQQIARVTLYETIVSRSRDISPIHIRSKKLLILTIVTSETTHTTRFNKKTGLDLQRIIKIDLPLSATDGVQMFCNWKKLRNFTTLGS